MDHTANAAFSTYKDALGWIVGLETYGMRPGLERMRRLMEKLGHPERRLKVVHVAGTNGKGSTCAYLSKVLEMSGYDVGTFTSPYIGKFTDRIRYNGEDIPETEVVKLANLIKPLADELAASELGSPTKFEVCTALAILYFAKVVYPDYVILETGLGGRLDSTNIVTPVLTIITNVGRDHMDILGDTITKIAEEKAGIIKSGVPVVSAAEHPEAVEVLARRCREKMSTLYLLGKQFAYEYKNGDWDRQTFNFTGPFRRLDGLTVSLNGEHQVKNAAVAVMALEVLRQYYALIFEDDVLQEALRSTRWPGRLEMIPGTPALLLDGAHNPEGAEALAHALRQHGRGKKLHMAIGMLASKDHRNFLKPLVPLVDHWIVTEPDFRNPLPAGELGVLVRELLDQSGRKAQVAIVPEWKQALQQLRQSAAAEDLAVVTGSLYFIADARSWILNGTLPEKGW